MPEPVMSEDPDPEWPKKFGAKLNVLNKTERFLRPPWTANSQKTFNSVQNVQSRARKPRRAERFEQN